MICYQVWTVEKREIIKNCLSKSCTDGGWCFPHLAAVWGAHIGVSFGFHFLMFFRAIHDLDPDPFFPNPHQSLMDSYALL